MITRLCIIGVGLIGGSLARSLKKQAAVDWVIGASRNQANLARARELGVIDAYTSNVADAVKNADMVVLAAPLGANRALLETILPALSSFTVLTDVGSAKVSVIEDVRTVFGELPGNFVPGHPIAGTEESGVEASFDTLFETKTVILTPLPETNLVAKDKVASMWSTVGAQVVEMTPENHDEVLSATSHLPHMLAYSLVNTLGAMDKRCEIFKYAAGGFHDFTRIASSDPTMWQDICLANREHLLRALSDFRIDLDRLSKAIEAGDRDFLKSVFAQAKNLRDGYI